MKNQSGAVVRIMKKIENVISRTVECGAPKRIELNATHKNMAPNEGSLGALVFVPNPLGLNAVLQRESQKPVGSCN
jgi:hypothetical protein